VHVRAILGHHLAAHRGQSATPGGDPNALGPVEDLARQLRELAAQEGPDALRRAAADYVALWSRTFRTLVRQLRGRPDRALALFAAEVYPFLRGDRLAARLESSQPGRVRLRLLGDLPDAYLAALVESFVAQTGAQCQVRAMGDGLFEASYRIPPRHRTAHWAQYLARLRFPLVLAALAACLLGVAMAAARSGQALPALRVLAVLAGGVAAQLGANAWHDLRHASPAGPLALAAPSRRQNLLQARLGFGTAGLCGAWLALDAPVVLLFAALGILASTLFGHLRAKGLGPIVAAATYGPLMAGGAYHAFVPLDLSPAVALPNLVPTMALGLTAAALLHLDDLADRPLDQAGGNRTLAVRLPQRRQAFLLDAVVLLAVGASVWWLWATPGLPFAVAAAALALPILAIAHRSLDDPAGLAPARLGAVLLHLVLAGAWIQGALP
jgi:1,4-dihydroxy-2-naphthoate octaprenyltransferase